MAEEDQDIVFDPHAPDSWFDGLFFDVLNPKEASTYFTNFNSAIYEDFLYQAFIAFQKRCRKTYESMIGQEDKAYFYFRDTLIEYQLLKEKYFFEKETHFYHILLNKPISKEGDDNQKIVYITYKYLNRALEILEDYSKKLSTFTPRDEKIEPIASKKKPKIHGFNVKRQGCLVDAYNQLKKLEIISKEVSYLDFEDVFSGKVPEDKIIWLKGPGLLSYFIRSISGVGIRDEAKNIWSTTINCFQDKDGKEFIIKQLRHSKTPKNLGEIKNVIDTFNKDSYSED